MSDYNIVCGVNSVIIPITETEANIVYTGGINDSYGTITVESNRTQPLTMYITDLTFGGVDNKEACIYFGNNNSLDNKLYFSGNNEIKNLSSLAVGQGVPHCAIRVVEGTLLIIISLDSSAVLTCLGRNSATAIGGDYKENGGNVTIAWGGSINCTSGYGAAGIDVDGEYIGGNSGNITMIGNGRVASRSIGEGAGIGGGRYGNSKNIDISGTVIIRSTAESGAVGIGGGYLGRAENINISIVEPGSIEAIGNQGGAGIDGGLGYGDRGGDIGTIKIYGSGKITAMGGENGAGIGGGNYGCSVNIVIVGWGIVSAKGNGSAQDIGKDGNCLSGEGVIILSNPNFQNVDNPELVKIKVLLKWQAYANKNITLIIGEDGEIRLETKTDNNRYAYFYANEGTYTYRAIEGSCTLDEDYFTVPPTSNVPTELIFNCNTNSSNVCRGLNLFS